MLEPLRKADRRDVGSYRLVARLPAGGMADVYLGQEPRGQVFVVKMAKADPAGLLADQFPQEMRAARLAHGRYLAEVVGMDPYASPPWLATQYVPGPSLLEVVRLHGPLPVDSVRALAGGLADALVCIHRSNVMHGDLTPGNVLLLADGPRVIDFGISSLLEATTTLAMDAPRFGTPGYLAPERLGPAAAKPTTASDVYSLGALLHFALTGEPPRSRLDGAPHVDRLPEPMRALVASCLAAEPGDRPEPAQVLQQLLPGGATVGSLYAVDWLPPTVYAQISSHGAELDRLLADLTAAPTPPATPPPDPPTSPAPQVPAPAAAAPQPRPVSPVPQPPMAPMYQPLFAHAAPPPFPHGPQPPFPHRPQPPFPHGPQPPGPYPPQPPGPSRAMRRLTLAAALAIVAATAIVVPLLATWPAARGSNGTGSGPNANQRLSSIAAGASSGTRSPGAAGSPSGIDEHPCEFEQREGTLSQLPYRCPMVWDSSSATLTRIPVFAMYDVANLDESRKIDELVKGAKSQYFKCHIQGAPYHYPAGNGLRDANHNWWAYTEGDNNYWGYVPEVYLFGGQDYLPDSGLGNRICTAEDTSRAGRT